MNDTITIDVQRYRPEQDEQPFMQRFQIAYDAEMSVLEALNVIKDRHDPSLSYRWSCRMAICGSCGFMINGVPKLGCKTFLRDYYPGVITIKALDNFPIERDLVADISDFVDKLEQVKPYIIRQDQPDLSAGEFLQTPEQLQRYKQFSQCINCGLCYAACPQYGLNNEFMGPAAMALLHRYNSDSRDQGKAQRYPIMNSEQGVWSCTFVGYCSEVCPKSVDPAAAINQSKPLSALDFLLSKIGQDATSRGQHHD